MATQRPVAATVGEPPIISVGNDGRLSQAQVNQLRSKIVELVRTVNALASLVSIGVRLLSGYRVQPGTKLPGLVVHTFATGAPEEVSHGLGRYPIGYLVLRRYPIGQVADASPEDWNPLTAWLQTDVAGLTVTVLFF